MIGLVHIVENTINKNLVPEDQIQSVFTSGNVTDQLTILSNKYNITGERKKGVGGEELRRTIYVQDMHFTFSIVR